MLFYYFNVSVCTGTSKSANSMSGIIFGYFLGGGGGGGMGKQFLLKSVSSPPSSVLLFIKSSYVKWCIFIAFSLSGGY